MPRLVSTAMLAALAAPTLHPAVLVEATFRTGTVYLWSGIGDMSWNGHTWTGIGTLGSIETIEEGATVEARGTVIKLSGIDPAMLQHVEGEFIAGQPVTIYLGLFNGGALIADPAISWRGQMDKSSINISGADAEIAIACESVLLEMNVAVDRRYTNDDQQRDWPGDLGLSFVNAIQEVALFWGVSPTTTGNI